MTNWDQANRRGIYSKEYQMTGRIPYNSKEQMRKDMDLYMPVKPISPSDVVAKKQEILPGEVIEAFNEMIAQHFSLGVSKFKQKDVLNKIIGKFQSTRVNDEGEMPNTSTIRNEIFDKCWLDVEDIYRAAGWKVEYDKPGYNESYDATFTFSKK